MDAKTQITHKILSGDSLDEKLQEWRSTGKKIVFTNGCFDLLHAGHLSYLAEAAALGDVLIIGLNSDTSVQVLKGPSRPVNPEQSRAIMLASMFFVSAVVLFSEQTPLNIIKHIKPNVLVKGGDYEIDQIVGADETLAAGGEVKVLPFLPGFSSTAIIDKIKNS